MPKRKKHPKLPNGYGTIRYLGKGRRNPYSVQPPAYEDPETGRYISPTALCYVSDWYVGFAVLTAYKAGTYTPGMEKNLQPVTGDDPDELVQHILADFSVIKNGPAKNDPTFAEVYEAFYADKYFEGNTYSQSSMYSTRAAFKNCEALHNKSFRSLVAKDLQDNLDACTLKHASLELIQNLYSGMYHYAEGCGLCDKNYAAYVTIKTEDDDESGVPFTEDQIRKFWQYQNDPIIEFALIMCYSGHRISEYNVLDIDLKSRLFKGGLKTKTSKKRTVPIHSAIYPLVCRRLKRDKKMLNMSYPTYLKLFKAKLKELGCLGEAPIHTPHDCRHTFSWLCQHCNVQEDDRKRLLGHTFNDVSNDTYGHRDPEDLCAEIEKIYVEGVTNV